MVPKVFIFGIDGGDWNLIEPLMRAGLMPNLARHLERSAWCEMTCTEPAHTAPGWASMVSGQYPGGHGIYQFFDTQHEAYGARVVESSDFACSTMWDWLAQLDWKLGLINVPMSHPPSDLPGYQITWPLANTLRYAAPPSLLPEMARCNCYFRSDLACMYRGDPGYVHEALANVEARTRSLEYLMQTRPVDAVMFVLTEVDRVCHHYWHHMDPAHPRFDPDPRYRNAIRDVHVAVDQAFGRALRMLPSDCSVVVVSDHGSGPGHDAVSVHQLLADWGMLFTTEAKGRQSIANWFVEGDRVVDFDRTRAYMPVPGSYGININLRGRQQRGIVLEEHEKALLQKIRDLLLDVRHPRSGKRVFSRVERREIAYPGRAMESAPDLLLVPEDAAVMVSGHLEGPLWKPSYQTGHHRFCGIWAHASRNVRAGKLSPPLRIVDVAPTLLAEVGASFPEGLAGVVRGDVFSNSFWTRRPGGLARTVEDVRRGPASRHARTGSSGEDELVAERLRAMGYL